MNRTGWLLCVVVWGLPGLLAAGSGPFNVADYGTKPNSPATDAFRKAIQAAKSAGGGTIYVPPGH